MKLISIRSFRLRLLFSILTTVYICYVLRGYFFSSSSCSHLYHVDSFHTCAFNSETCNLSSLLHSYMTYRTCVLRKSPVNARYVVFDAVNGMGNRILGLVAVTTYALLTSRVLLINWRPGDNHQASFDDLFLPLSSTDQVPLHFQYSLSRLAHLIRNRWSNEIQSNMQSNRIPQDWSFYFDRDLLCGHDTSSRTWFEQLGFMTLNWIGNRVLWIRTDQYFVPLLTRNERNQQAFIKLFSNGQVFSELAYRLVQPVLQVHSIVEEFQKQHPLDDGTITIGMHMRSWSSSLTGQLEPFHQCFEHVLRNLTRSVIYSTFFLIRNE